MPLPPLLQPACPVPQLQALFLQWFPAERLQGWLPAGTPRGFYRRVFNPLVTLWYFIFQRLHRQGKLQHVVNDVHRGGGDALHPDGQRLSQKIQSWSTAAWSDARQRLPLAVFEQALAYQAASVGAWVKNLLWRGLRVQSIDGSTIRLRPLDDMPVHFPAHRTRRKNSYWCLARVVVSFCAPTALVTGCALGACQVSEQVLACQLILQALPASLYIGDRNFGVYRILQAVTLARVQALVRLTDVRARALGSGRSLRRSGVYAVTWRHSRQDQLLPAVAAPAVAGRLIVARLHRAGFRTQWLLLFTTLTDETLYPAAQLVALYKVRWEAELNLRSLKTSMDLEMLAVQSADLARKEWWAGLLAYNLVRAAMLNAALQRGVAVKGLSFSNARDLLLDWVKQWGSGQRNPAVWKILWEGIIGTALPKRRKRRPSEPRAKRPDRSAVPTFYGSRQQARTSLKAKLKS